MAKKQKPAVFEITCPCCKAKLQVDGELEQVLSHEVPKQQLVTDLAEAARALREKESHRDEQFEKSVQAEKDRRKLMERKFEEAFKKAKDEPITPPGPRDIDLD